MITLTQKEKYQSRLLYIAAISYIFGGAVHLLGHLLTPKTLFADPVFEQIYVGTRTIGESFIGFSLMLALLLISFGFMNITVMRNTYSIEKEKYARILQINTIVSLCAFIIAYLYLPIAAVVIMALGTLAFTTAWVLQIPTAKQHLLDFISNPGYFFRTVALYWLYSATVGWLNTYGYITEHHSDSHDTLLNFSDPLRTSEHTGLTILYLLLSFMPRKIRKIGIWFFAIFGTSVFIYINIVSPLFLGTTLVFYPGHEFGHFVISAWAWSLIVRKKL